jgi:hypothetical protein
MANSIKIKRSAVAAKVPLTTDLALGELAINTYDGKLYLKKDNGTESIITVNAGGGGSGDVVGPGSSTDNAITRFDGATGLIIQNSTATLDDSGAISVSGANISGLVASSAVATDGSYNLVSVANTGTGDNVLATSPTLVTPALGTPTALVGTNISGTATAFTASNVTTNANLTGAITSVGNAASLGSFTSAQLATALTDETGTGANVFATSPTLVTPVLGAATATTLAVSGSINTPNTFGFKNRIINGAMVIDQRNAAASQTFTAAGALAYSVDRWYGYCTGANVTGQQVAGATTPTVTQNRYRFTGAASVTAVGFGQRIEQKNSYDLAGSTCTLSADLGISATLTTVTWTAYYATTTADTFGSLASPTVTSIATGTFTVGATVANFSANISIPAAATKGIQILFTVGALTAGLTWTVGNVQLEKGSTATSFDYRPYGTELALSQRYYFKTIFQSGYVATLQAFSATNAFGVLCYPPIPMRAAPSTVTTSTIGNFRLYDAAANPAAVTTTFNVAMSTGPLYCTQVSRTGLGMVAGTAVVMDVSTTSYVDASAEL